MKLPKLTDDVIRTTLRNYRIKYGRDPKALVFNYDEMQRVLQIYDKKYATPLEGTKLYGIPVELVKGSHQGQYDKNGCRRNSAFAEDLYNP